MKFSFKSLLIVGVLAMLSACTAPTSENGIAASPPQVTGFTTAIEVVVPRGTTALAFVPNANRDNFDDGRPATGIALLGSGEPLPIDPNFVIQRVTLHIPAGMREAVLCSGSVPGVGYHESFNSSRIAAWRRGEPKKGLAAVISTADRNRLGPLVGPVERARGYPKHL